MSLFQKKIRYISDGANWVENEIGLSLQKGIGKDLFEVTNNFLFHIRGVNHYSNRYRAKWLFYRNPFVKNVITYAHGEDSETALIETVKKNLKNIDMIHTLCQYTKDHLVRCGVDESKVMIVPIGIDVDMFSKPSAEEKKKLREKYNVPLDATVIGSFQKDGNGWGEGLEPKLCKGPDLFCDAVEEIHKAKPLFVFLTGPARGYVKKRLDKAGIPYAHVFLDDYSEVINCFKILDLYLVSSRLEGGPRAPMECQATGVPVVSTRVGQVPEVIQNGENGFIVEVGDVKAMVEKCLLLLNDEGLVNKMTMRGLESVKRFDFKNLSKEYYEKLYKPFL